MSKRYGSTTRTMSCPRCGSKVKVQYSWDKGYNPHGSGMGLPPSADLSILEQECDCEDIFRGISNKFHKQRKEEKKRERERKKEEAKIKEEVEKEKRPEEFWEKHPGYEKEQNE